MGALFWGTRRERVGRRGRDVEGARILLTGASSGIGRALALQLGRRGARLAVAARRTEELTGLGAELVRDGALAPVVLPADLSHPGRGERLVTDAVAALAGLDVVISNAGAGLVGSQALGDDRTARELFELNYWTPLALVAAALPHLRASPRPVAVMVTSSLQAVPVPLLGYYGASKAALALSTQALRAELRGHGVRVVEVVPGATDTAARDVGRLPWRGTPPRMPPPAAPEAVAAAVVRALERGGTRVVHPVTSLVPLELPAVGRLVARVAAGRLRLA